MQPLIDIDWEAMRALVGMVCMTQVGLTFIRGVFNFIMK